MFIDFGHNDPNVDISGVEFALVNAVVIYQDTRWVLKLLMYLYDFCGGSSNLF